MAKDPVCEMEVEEGKIYSEYDGEIYFFCSERCKTTFQKNPAHSLRNKSDKGFFKRFLKWLAKGSADVPKSCHEIKK